MQKLTLFILISLGMQTQKVFDDNLFLCVAILIKNSNKILIDFHKQMLKSNIKLYSSAYGSQYRSFILHLLSRCNERTKHLSDHKLLFKLKDVMSRPSILDANEYLGYKDLLANLMSLSVGPVEKETEDKTLALMKIEEVS